MNKAIKLKVVLFICAPVKHSTKRDLSTFVPMENFTLHPADALASPETSLGCIGRRQTTQLPYVQEETFRICFSVTLILMALSLMWGICFILCKVRTYMTLSPTTLPGDFEMVSQIISEENREINFQPQQRGAPSFFPDVVVSAATVNAHGE